MLLLRTKWVYKRNPPPQCSRGGGGCYIILNQTEYENAVEVVEQMQVKEISPDMDEDSDKSLPKL